jgi:hypothetical protein
MNVKSLFKWFGSKPRLAAKPAAEKELSREEFNRLCIPGHYSPFDPNRGSIFDLSEMKRGRDGAWRSGAQREQRSQTFYRPDTLGHDD